MSAAEILDRSIEQTDVVIRIAENAQLMLRKAIAQRDALADALRPIATAYPDDPGTSDLYDEQPVTITLGDVRRAQRALAKVGA